MVKQYFFPPPISIKKGKLTLYFRRKAYGRLGESLYPLCLLLPTDERLANFVLGILNFLCAQPTSFLLFRSSLPRGHQIVDSLHLACLLLALVQLCQYLI